MPEYMTTEDVGMLLRCSPSTLRAWRYRSFGPPWLRTGPKKVIYRRADVEEWVESQFEADGFRGLVAPRRAL
jgi:hypothetical protein